MDNTSGLKAAVLRIRDSINRFAESKLWNRSDYYLEMIANVVWLQIIVEIYAKEYDSLDTDENVRYDEIYDYLEKDLKDDPELYESISILIAPFGLRFSKPMPLGENHVQVDASWLNPGVDDPQTTSQVTTRGGI